MSYKLFSVRNSNLQNDDQWAERTVEGEIESVNNRTLINIFDRFLTGSNLKILEGGCGLGGWVHFLKEKGHQVIGLEYEKEVVERVKDYDESFPIQHGDITQLEFDDNTFDAYISLGVVEHFEEGPQKALQEAWRTLKPGGLALVSIPYFSIARRFFTHPLRDLYFAIRKLSGKEKFYWEYRYTKKELSFFLKEAGLEVIYTGIDDYIPEDNKHHIGLYADFFFLRKKGGGIWELNLPGQIILRLGKFFSPWLFCSGLHMVARKVA